VPPRWAGARGNPVSPSSKRGRGAGQSGFPSSRRGACRPGGQGRGATRLPHLPSGAGAQGNLVSPLPGGGLAAPEGRGAGQPGFSVFQAGGWPPRRAGVWGNPVAPPFKRGRGARQSGFPSSRRRACRPGGQGRGATRFLRLPSGGLAAPEGGGLGKPGFPGFYQQPIRLRRRGRGPAKAGFPDFYPGTICVVS